MANADISSHPPALSAVRSKIMITLILPGRGWTVLIARVCTRVCREKERRIVELDRPALDPAAVQKLRANLARDLSALRQHAQRYSNASAAVDVVAPGIEANAAAARQKIATHFGYVRRQLQDREEKLTAIVESLAEERLQGLRAQKGRMEGIVAACEGAIQVAQVRTSLPRVVWERPAVPPCTSPVAHAWTSPDPSFPTAAALRGRSRATIFRSSRRKTRWRPRSRRRLGR